VGGGGGAWMRFDKFVVGVRERGNFVDGIFMMWLESDLPAIGPGTFDPWIIGEGAEMGVIGGS